MWVLVKLGLAVPAVTGILSEVPSPQLIVILLMSFSGSLHLAVAVNTVEPAVPDTGATLSEQIGGLFTAETTVKHPVQVPLCPLGLVTVTFRAPTVAVAEIVMGTSTSVDETKVTAPTVIPVPLKLTVGVLAKFVPGILTVNLGPCVRFGGTTEVGLGPAETTTVKHPVQVPLCPLGLVTVTFRAPTVAVAEIVMGTSTSVDETKVTAPTVIPVPLKLTVGVLAKFVPRILTVKLCPCVPFGGTTDVGLGPAETITVKHPEHVPLCLSGLVAVTSCGPVGALPAMEILTVADEGELIVSLRTVIPDPKANCVFPPRVTTKFVPLTWTVRFVPCVPCGGLTEVTVGGGPRTVTVTVGDVPCAPNASVAVTETKKVPGVF